MDQAVSMTYYRVLQEGEDEILRTVAEQGPVLVSIDHRTRTFMASLCDRGFLLRF